jgi:hypothetical protein
MRLFLLFIFFGLFVALPFLNNPLCLIFPDSRRNTKKCFCGEVGRVFQIQFFSLLALRCFHGRIFVILIITLPGDLLSDEVWGDEFRYRSKGDAVVLRLLRGGAMTDNLHFFCTGFCSRRRSQMKTTRISSPMRCRSKCCTSST